MILIWHIIILHIIAFAIANAFRGILGWTASKDMNLWIILHLEDDVLAGYFFYKERYSSHKIFYNIHKIIIANVKGKKMF